MNCGESTLVKIGFITRTHGLDGKVVVYLTTDVPDRIKPGGKFYLDKKQEVVVGTVSKFKDRFIVSFESLTTVDLAKNIVRKSIWAEGIPHDISTEFWVSDLFDSYIAESNGDIIGKVTCIIDNPASDILELDNDILIPFRFVYKLIQVDLSIQESSIELQSITAELKRLLTADSGEQIVKIAFANLPEGLTQINSNELEVNKRRKHT